MTRALYKSLLMLKEIRVKLLQRGSAFFAGPKDLHLPFHFPKTKCRFFAHKAGLRMTW
jgi:hypothetical protein